MFVKSDVANCYVVIFYEDLDLKFKDRFKYFIYYFICYSAAKHVIEMIKYISIDDSLLWLLYKSFFYGSSPQQTNNIRNFKCFRKCSVFLTKRSMKQSNTVYRHFFVRDTKVLESLNRIKFTKLCFV